MGKRQRRREREQNLRKWPDESEAEFWKRTRPRKKRKKR